MKVLHILDHSLPYLTDYSLKTRYIIKLQKDLGIKPYIITSPRHETISNPVELIEGIYHYRSVLPQDYEKKENCCPLKQQKIWIRSIEKMICKVVQSHKIDLVHVHSPALNGIASIQICRQKHIPILYEIRDITHVPSVNHEEAMIPLIHGINDYLEAFLYQTAGALIVKEKKARQLIINRGVPEDKIFLIPSGEDAPLLQFNKKDEHIVNKYDLQNSPILGFMGSFFHHEGVNHLLEALLKIRKKIPKTKLLLLDQEKKQQINSSHKDISGHIIYIGQVNQTDFQRYYSLIDILVFPKLSANNKGDSIFQQPLKTPTDNKIILTSGKEGLRELVMDKKTSFSLKPCDISDLTGKCLKVAMNKQFHQNINTSQMKKTGGRKWVCALAEYLKVYKNLLSQ